MTYATGTSDAFGVRVASRRERSYRRETGKQSLFNSIDERKKGTIMQITIEIPEDIGNQLQQNWQDLPQKILETLAREAYRSGIMTAVQIQELLQFDSLSKTQVFLNQSQVSLDYTQENLGQAKQTKMLADNLKELQQICIEEDYSLEISSRQDRPNLFF